MTHQNKMIIIKELQASFLKIASEKKKLWWEKYMRNVINFRGVGIPDIRNLQKKWYKKHLEHLSYKEQIEITLEFFRQDLAEDKLAGILLLQNYLFDKESLSCMIEQYDVIFKEELIYDWNICDWFCVRVLSATIKKYERDAANIISSWSNDPYLWKARASVVAFIGLTKEDKYYSHIFENCSVLIQREERFAKTCVGWILHDIYKADEKVVFDFVNKYLKHFDKESLKNALKYADKEVQKKYLLKLS